MKELVNQRATYTFGLLVLITTLSLWLTAGHGAALFHEGEAVLWTQIIVLAFLKVRWILLDFMELRTAPMKLRLTFELWALAVAGTLIVTNLAVG